MDGCLSKENFTLTGLYPDLLFSGAHELQLYELNLTDSFAFCIQRDTIGNLVRGSFRQKHVPATRDNWQTNSQMIIFEESCHFQEKFMNFWIK